MKNYKKPNLEEENIEIEDIVAGSLDEVANPASADLDDPDAETIGG